MAEDNCGSKPQAIRNTEGREILSIVIYLSIPATLKSCPFGIKSVRELDSLLALCLL